MDLENRTPLAAFATVGAALERHPEDLRDLMATRDGAPAWMRAAGLVIVKATFEVRGGGLRLAAEQSPVLEKDDGGPPFIEKDTAFRKDGVDVAVIGFARAPDGEPVPEMDVSFKIEGALDRRLRVFGDRVWRKKLVGFRIGPPEAFVEMPLTPERAFGGKSVDHEGKPISFPLNPEGKGFAPKNKRARVEGVALPNVEDPARLIASMDDMPDPAGFGFLPFTAGLRLREGVRPRERGAPEILPRAHNAAFPGMILAEYPAGAAVTVEGMTAPGPWTFKLPAFPAHAMLADGGRESPLALEPDTICLVPDRGLLVLTAKARFDSDVRVPERRRAIVLPEEA